MEPALSLGASDGTAAARCAEPECAEKYPEEHEAHAKHAKHAKSNDTSRVTNQGAEEGREIHARPNGKLPATQTGWRRIVRNFTPSYAPS